jgi:hypothetical protein
MDILQKYNEENPEILHQDSPCDPSGEYGALVCTVMRLSAGRIQNAKQADKVLFGIAIAVFILTFFVVAKNFNLLPTGRFSAEDARRQIEEYRKIQPF